MKKCTAWLLAVIMIVASAVPALAYEKDGWEYTCFWGRDKDLDQSLNAGIPELYDGQWLYGTLTSGGYGDEPETLLGYYINGYLGEEETVKVPGTIEGHKIIGIAMLYKYMELPDGGCLDYGNGILESTNTTTTKVILPCTVDRLGTSEYALYLPAFDEEAKNYLETIVLPPEIDYLTPAMLGSKWVQEGEKHSYPDLTVICEKDSTTHAQLLKLNQEAAAGKELTIQALPASDPELLAIHNWDEGSTNAAGKFVYTCEDCGEVREAETNEITVSNKFASFSAKKQKIKLDASALGESKLTYKSSNSKVKVSKSGVVTLPKKFSGKATITITATDASKIYDKVTKKVTVTVPKAPTLKTVKSSKSKQLTVKWSKVKGATGYQLYYKVGSKAKTVKISKAATVKKVIKKLKKGKTYKVKVRSYIKDGKTLYYSNWSKVKKAKVK